MESHVRPDAPSPAQLHAQAWAESFDLIDLQLSPLGLQAIEALPLCNGNTVVDIGCGTGQTLLQLAERVGDGGQVIGVDVAPLLLDVAQRRTGSLPQIRLIEADAQFLSLPNESADAVFSRFGVMAFKDPVAAFANFRRILKPSGALAFACWRSLRENELDHFPLAAADLGLLVDETPFTFSDPENVRCTLQSAGFRDISIQPYDKRVSSGDLNAMTQVLMKVGPLGRIVRERPSLQTTAEPRLRAALAALKSRHKVELSAATWIVVARA